MCETFQNQSYWSHFQLFLIVSLFLTIMYSLLVIHQLNALEILLLSILINRDTISYHFWDNLATWAVRLCLCLILPGNSTLGTVPSNLWLGRSSASVFLSYECNIFLATANAWEPLCKSCKPHVSHGDHAGIFYVSSVLFSKVSMKNWRSVFECPWSFQSK